MKNVNPYLNFPGNTEEAFGFYRSVFGGEFPMRLRFRDLDPSMNGPDGDKLAHIALPIGNGSMLMGTDALEAHGRALTVGNNFSISVEPESTDEAQRLFAALSEGGTIGMPLSRTEWAELYGMCTDRYGIQWMLNYPGSVQFGGPPER